MGTWQPDRENPASVGTGPHCRHLGGCPSERQNIQASRATAKTRNRTKGLNGLNIANRKEIPRRYPREFAGPPSRPPWSARVVGRYFHERVLPLFINQTSLVLFPIDRDGIVQIVKQYRVVISLGVSELTLGSLLRWNNRTVHEGAIGQRTKPLAR